MRTTGSSPAFATEDCSIELDDGVTLAARVWIPDQGRGAGFTTLLEVTPYRYRDIQAVRDSENHGCFATHGYASVRIDMRGTGNSTGLSSPMLSRQERQDTLAVIGWILRQPWSNGKVVLFGISWGAINAMLTAAERPSAVKAVVALSFYHDAFRHGLNFKGGCLTNEALAWSAAVLGYHSRPPDPLCHPATWVELWRSRIEAAVPEIEQSLLHPYRDDYWDERTIPNLDAIQCPVLVMSGLNDGNFTSAVPAALEQLGERVTAIIGPWAHRWPHAAVPGPGIAAIPLICEWLDQQVNGGKSGAAMPLGSRAVWIEEARPARSYYATARGGWVQMRGALQGGYHRAFLSPGGLTRARCRPKMVTLAHSGVAIGLSSGEIMPAFNAGPGAELAGDQRADDARSLTFDSRILDAPLVLLGSPLARLRLRVNAPVAQICVRLCEIQPTGESVRISYGAKNLCAIDERNPALLEPAKVYEVAVPLDFCSYRFSAGHRIRVALSTSYWPLLWPSPVPADLELFLGDTFIDLPLCPMGASPLDDAYFHRPYELRSAIDRVELRAASRRRWIEQHPYERLAGLHIDDDNGRYRLGDTGIEIDSTMKESYAVHEQNALSAQASASWTWSMSRGDWSTRVESGTTLQGNGDSFTTRCFIRAWNEDQKETERDWTISVSRRYL